MVSLKQIKKANKLKITDCDLPKEYRVSYIERDKKTRRWDCSDNEQSGEMLFLDDELTHESLDEPHIKVEVRK